MKKAVFLAGLVLAACASTDSASDWTHATKDSSEWKPDMVECERFFGGGGEGPVFKCMNTKGWRLRRR